MTQMTNAQARGVDPIISEVVRGFEHPDNVGEQLFPVVNVSQRGGKVLQFGRESFKIYNTVRTPGSGTKRVTYGYSGVPYSLEDHSLEGIVPFETDQEAAAVAGIDMAEGALYLTDWSMALGLEKQRADIARNASLYSASNKIALTTPDQISTTTSNFFNTIRVGREAIRAKIGKYPNIAFFPAPVFEAACDHPLMLDRTKYTTADSISPDMLARALRIPKLVVAPAVYVDDSDVQQDVWGKDIILAYVNVSPLTKRTMGTPSAFYTYNLRGYPFAEVPYQDRNAKSDIFPMTHCRAPVAAGIDAAYLIQNAVA